MPGFVSTEVDANLSFNIGALVARARQIIDAYKQRGVGPERVLIKLASTWEGIRAAEILQSEGVKCNMTLLLNRAQAIASAEAGAFLISPFVGRIYDWPKKSGGKDFAAAEDPGSGPCGTSTGTTSRTASRRSSWARHFATLARSRRWPVAIG